MAGYTTVSRTKILEYLKNNSNRTVNVSDISDYLKSNMCEVNVSTIYRYLDKLAGEGTVIKYVAEKGSMAVYQYVETGHRCEEHLHLKCVKCGSVIHMECDFMKEISEHIKDHHGFDIQCKNSMIYGVCKNCRSMLRQ